MTVVQDFITLELLAKRLRDELGSMAVVIAELDGASFDLHAMVGFKLPERFPRANIPIPYAISTHVVEMNYPLQIDDANSHPLIPNHPAVRELGIGAYLGAPMHRPDGTAFGTVAALHRHRRSWQKEDLFLVEGTARKAEEILNRQGASADD
ncbi:GAF domain-containing protein [Sulfitobacter sp. D35]|uniref:GAF domain-containing protein n=1 Tax=Sulfitobacter sp. D35 TaxID=3083252 RepID=UPI00296E4355|nr:GAF domain-containing protein [Sulfitobacter sp. D35]MDW4496731.1 GAF domain-containing protein [Sulfitobacter sp. D35]